MRGASFPRWAALSLAIHLGLAVGAAVLEARRAAPPPSSKGSSESRATGASADVGGETFDVAEEVPDLEAPSEPPALPPPPTVASDPGAAGNADLELDDPPASKNDDRAQVVNSAHHAGRATHAAAATSATAEAPPPPPPLYGAIGDRAASDLVTAFKKQFATGASSDPIWNEVPVGFYASGDVTFYLSPEGRLLRTTLSEAAAPAFRAAVGRTVALIKGRSFTAHGERTHLRVVVRVSGDLVNHGAFTVNAEGSFELPSGRHVSVRVDER